MKFDIFIIFPILLTFSDFPLRFAWIATQRESSKMRLSMQVTSRKKLKKLSEKLQKLQNEAWRLAFYSSFDRLEKYLVLEKLERKMLSRRSKNLAKLESRLLYCIGNSHLQNQAWQGFSTIETTSFRSKNFQTKYFFKQSKLVYKASLEASFCSFWRISNNFLSFFREVTSIDNLILEDSRWVAISCKSKGGIGKLQ